ncbi:MAG: hypothetical protein M1824_000932 [Vezdaea acicularis]|nr:MAG: hypothetical protein M1824_000932 [Vezdaea acicularis]
MPPPAPPSFDDDAGPGPATEEIEQVQATSTRGTKAELKQLDGRYDHLGNYNVTDSSVSILDNADGESEPHADFALVSTRVYGVDGVYQSTNLEIKSRLIKKVLRKVIKYYPGQPVDTAQLTLSDPPKPLFHYRQELEDYRHQKADEETKKHLDLLFKFVDSLLKTQVERFKDLAKRGLTSFGVVWMLFKPGDLVFTEKDGQPCAYMIQKCESVSTFFGKYWQLTCAATNYNGTRIGRATETLTVRSFEGTRDITSLNVFPLKYHPKEAQIKHQLLERGKRFVAMQGTHYMSYKGLAQELTEGSRIDYDDEMSMDGERLYKTILVNGRIMVDAATFSRINPSNRIRFEGDSTVKCDCSSCRARASPSSSLPDPESNLPPGGITKAEQEGDHAITALSERDTMLCSPFVLGFSLQNKKWCRFFIDMVKPVELNTQAFSQLVMDQEKKELVLAMVEAHVDEDNEFDDIIQGKGKSLIMLLHGAPGVGKTLTAESIADYTKRPLYMVSSGELGTHATEVESTLQGILDIATTWKAVVLLDEADVFLSQRSGTDVERNALVSIFLRLLEYYEGILFLTSNRVESFDLAFKSRIHIALNYPTLTRPIRRQIWSDFINRLPKNTWDLDLEKDLSVLDLEDINGRQIKNCTKTSAALARKKGEKMQLKHLETTLATIREFERDFAKDRQNGDVRTVLIANENGV